MRARNAMQPVLGGLVGLALAGSVACAVLGPGIEPPEVHVIGLTPLEQTLFEYRVRVDLRLRNPNDFPLECDGIDFELVVNGTPLTRGLSNEAFTLPRLGEQVVHVTASSSSLDLVRQVVGLAGNVRFDYEVDGRVHLTAPRERTLRFSHSGSAVD